MFNLFSSEASALVQTRMRTDRILFLSAALLAVLGLLTMNSFQSPNPYFGRQALWLAVSIGAFFVARGIDWRILRHTGVAASIYGIGVALLALLFVAGHVAKGAQSWFSFGFFSFEPVEMAVIALIIVLAKYFSKRHVEIAHFKHIIVSGVYAFILFALVLLQPDFGGAIIIFLLWLGMVLISGISRTHLFAIFAIAAVAFAGLWTFGFHDYQRTRVLAFLHPLADIRGAGYNANQAMIAIGSGELVGKGIGYGTQSKLRFLPEYQTDFMFAAFAEEWGFVGVMLIFMLYGALFWWLLSAASRGATNFETLFILGVLAYFIVHFMLHVGINLGLLPVTGTTIPFMSYGGSHLLVEFVMIGMAAGMNRYGRIARSSTLLREFSGGYDV